MSRPGSRGRAKGRVRPGLARVELVLTWPMAVAVLPLSVLAFAIASPQALLGAPARSLVALALAHLALLGAVALGRAVAGRTGRDRGAVALAVYLVAAALRALVLSESLLRLGVAPVRDLGFRLAAGTVSVTAILVMFALATTSVREHRARVRRLGEQRDRLERTREDLSRAIADRTRGTVDAITARLLAVVERLGDDLPAEAVARLRHAARDVVRPLSHELAGAAITFAPSEPPARERRLDWRRVLTEATSGRRPLPVRGGVAILLVTSATIVIRGHGLPAGPVILLLAGVVAGAGAALGNAALVPRLGSLPVWRRAVRLTAWLLVIGLAVGATPLAVGRPVQPALLVGGTVFVVLNGWGLMLVTATGRARAATLAELESLTRSLEWEVVRANERQWQRQRALSLALHGPVQAAVDAAVLRLELAVRAGRVDGDLVRSLQDQIATAVRALPVDDPPGADLEATVDAVRSTWSGVCEVTVDAPPAELAAVTADPVAARAVGDLLTEAVSNAVRHGGARSVAARLTLGGVDRVVLVVENDGEPSPAARGRGLGSALLDDVTLEWSIEPRPAGGARLRAVLPLHPVAEPAASTG